MPRIYSLVVIVLNHCTTLCRGEPVCSPVFWESFKLNIVFHFDPDFLLKLIPEVHPSMQQGNNEYFVFVHAVYDAMFTNLMRPDETCTVQEYRGGSGHTVQGFQQYFQCLILSLLNISKPDFRRIV